MTDLAPGSLVECIEGHTDRGLSVERGRIYTVTEVMPAENLTNCAHGPNCHREGLKLREAPIPFVAYWCGASFVPVGRPASDLIAHFTQRQPEGVAA